MKKQTKKPIHTEIEPQIPIVNDRIRSKEVRINMHARLQYKPKVGQVNLAYNHRLPKTYEIDSATFFNSNHLNSTVIKRESSWLFQNRKAKATIKTSRTLIKQYSRHLPPRMLQFCVEFDVGFKPNFVHLSLFERPAEVIDFSVFCRLVRRPKYLKKASICEEIRAKQRIFKRSLFYLPLATERFAIGRQPVLISSFEAARKDHFLTSKERNDVRTIVNTTTITESELSNIKLLKLTSIRLLKMYMFSVETNANDILTCLQRLTKLQTLKILFTNIATLNFDELLGTLSQLGSLRRVKVYFLQECPEILEFFKAVEANRSLTIEIKIAARINQGIIFTQLPKISQNGIILKHSIKNAYTSSVRSNLVTLRLIREANDYVIREIRGDFFEKLPKFLAKVQSLYPFTRELTVKWQSNFYSDFELAPFIEDMTFHAKCYTMLKKVTLSMEALRFQRNKPLAFLKSFELLGSVTDFTLELIRGGFLEWDVPSKELMILVSSLVSLKNFALKMHNLKEPFGSKFLSRLIGTLPEVEKFSFEGTALDENGKGILKNLERRRGVPPYESWIEGCSDGVEKTIILFRRPEKSNNQTNSFSKKRRSQLLLME